MLASEYLNKLEAMIEEHGDHPCVDSFDQAIEDPEFSDEIGNSAFVLAEMA